ncbi:MAG: isocitrate lyase/phosphoenolpyruvate mutase family protein [Actinomycetota bacterium]|nr:isocitrate lyase/phosphoenolpyruvate mutase family protein [Actinomycetota bacterium]
MTISQQDKAARFHHSHAGDEVLALANAWDVASALVSVRAGVRAVATTSSGVAWSLGAPDGDALDRRQALDLIARVVAAVDVPVSADIETGFGATPDDVASTVRDVLAAGAVGVNMEDSYATERGPLRDIDEQARRYAAARGAATEAGIDLFINARTDAYLRQVGTEDERLTETLDRARAYLDAGASGIFVPGLTDLATIRTLAARIEAPLNIMVAAGSPTVRELAEAGVARVSMGGAIAEAAYGLARRATVELLEKGTYNSVADGMTWTELNALYGK